MLFNFRNVKEKEKNCSTEKNRLKDLKKRKNTIRIKRYQTFDATTEAKEGAMIIFTR